MPQLPYFEKKILKTEKNATFADPKRDDGAIAQLVEQRTENPCVAGSIPAGTTKKAKAFSRKIKGFFVSVIEQAHCPSSYNSSIPDR